MSSLSVRIPEGASPGESLTFPGRDGRTYTFAVPAGATPGMVILVNTPAHTLTRATTPPLRSWPAAPAAPAVPAAPSAPVAPEAPAAPAGATAAKTTNAATASAAAGIATQAPPLGSYSDSDEIAIRELLIQRCLEICRLHGAKSTYKVMSTILRGEFGEERFQRYKSLVEYHMKRNALSLQQQESKRQRALAKSVTGAAVGGGGAATINDNALLRIRSESKLELPRLVACLGGCGFWGSPDTKNLCNKCFSNLVQNDVKRITREQAVQDMLRKLGFSSVEDYMLDLAFARRFPGEVHGDELREELPGMRKWFNSARPITQFDKAPEKGTTACTYISGVTAMRALLRGEFAETPSAWADCILRGVVAFHAAARSDPRLKGHSHICEAMPYALEVLGCTPADAQRFVVRERVVLLYLDPVFEGSQPSEILGSVYADGVGKEGLVPTLRMALEESQALVITRPPETWAVTLEVDDEEAAAAAAAATAATAEAAGSGRSSRSSSGGTVRMRDSHRRAQLDFESVDAFLSWVAVDRAFFASVPSTGIDMNSVSVSWFIKNGRSGAPVTADVVISVDSASKGMSSAAASAATYRDDVSAALAAAAPTPPEAPVPPPVSPYLSQGLMQIMDRLFIATYSLACSRDMLHYHKCTHIINVAPSATEGEDKYGPSCPNAYPAEFQYCNIPIEDPMGDDFPNNNDVAVLFVKKLETVAEYLKTTLAIDPPACVLMHSNDADKSVLPSLIIAFLVIHHQYTLSAAYTVVEPYAPDVSPSFAAFQALVAIEEKARGGATSMSIDERSTDIIMGKITDMGFEGVDRGEVLASVQKDGPRAAQQRLLNECLGGGPG